MPLQVLVDKFSHARFEPSGITKNPDVRFAKSIVDYIFRWLATKFLSTEAQFHAGVNLREGAGIGEQGSAVRRPGPATPIVSEKEADPAGMAARAKITVKISEFAAIQSQEDAPPCSTCGSIMIRSGSCYKCTNCGTTSGCA